MDSDMQMSSEEKRQLDNNTEMTKEIHQAVVGNANLGQVGLVGQVKRVHERLDTHEREDRESFEQVREQGRKLDKRVSAIFTAFATVMIGLQVYEAMKK